MKEKALSLRFLSCLVPDVITGRNPEMAAFIPRNFGNFARKNETFGAQSRTAYMGGSISRRGDIPLF